MSLYPAIARQPEQRANVLFYIALHGTKSGYELSKELGIRDSTVHYALKQLAKRGMVRAVQRKKREGFRYSILYRLTTLGLLIALTMNHDSKIMREIVEMWPEVCPKILLNWKKLSVNLRGHYFKYRVLSVALLVLSGDIRLPREIRYREPIDYADFFTTVFLNPFTVAEEFESGSRNKERLIKAVCGIPELRAELSEKLKLFEKAYRSRLDMVVRLQHMVEAESVRASMVSADRSYQDN